jgi:2-polyprenyl-3-methyl-5-hydroxy-6-metoxy-1,4-benzoquinol methylase
MPLTTDSLDNFQGNDDKLLRNIINARKCVTQKNMEVILEQLVDVDCVLCGSNRNVPVLTTSESFSLVRCAECDFQFYSPRPTDETVEAYYHGEQFYEKPNIPAIKLVMDIIGHRQISLGKLLDIGCGVGALVSLAEKKGWSAIGVDSSPKAKELAKKVLGVDIVASYVHDLDLPPASFDVVVLLAVLEHAFDPLSIMKRVQYFLKPGGWVIFSTPNLDNVNYHALEDKRSYSWFIKEHINHFTIKTHRELLRQSGFTSPEFHLCGHFVLENSEKGMRICPNPSFLRAARKLHSDLQNSITGHKADTLSDSELLKWWSQKAEACQLPPGEYSLSDAVYVSAQKQTIQ